jgi:hypothetical protein
MNSDGICGIINEENVVFRFIALNIFVSQSHIACLDEGCSAIQCNSLVCLQDRSYLVVSKFIQYSFRLALLNELDH